ncbi:MAG: hypothetical protein ACE5K4_10785 [Candidatus Hydrothermarchaeota archaeon]
MKKSEKKKSILSVFFFNRDGKTYKKVPLAPNPNNAMLTTIKAKWYHWVTENILVRDISNRRVAIERKNMPM